MFLVTGGYDRYFNHLDTTETYDPLLGSWVVSGASLPQPMEKLRAANINDRVLIFGNIIISSPYSKKTEVLYPKSPSNVKFKKSEWDEGCHNLTII